MGGGHLPLPGIMTEQIRNLFGDATCPQCGAQWSRWPMQPRVLEKGSKPAPAKRSKRK
jgi:hypothetical protein